MVSLHHFPSPTTVMIGYFCCILISLVVKTFTSPEAAEDMQGAVLFWCPCRVKLDWLVKWQKRNIACRHFQYVYRKYIATDLLKPAVKWKCLLERGKVHVPSPSNVKIQTGFNKLLLLLHAMLFFFFFLSPHLLLTGSRSLPLRLGLPRDCGKITILSQGVSSIMY